MNDPRGRGLRILVPALVPLAFFLAVVWTTADFGFHWDEPTAQLGPVKDSLQRGTLLPGYYVYPGLNYWLNLSALAPDLLHARRDGLSRGETRRALAAAATSKAYLLRARRVHMALAGLAIVWTYLLVLALGRPVAEAFLASSLVALSWEVVYHSRWIAPDSVLMQFAVLAVLAAVAAEREPRRRVWPLLAAVAAGLGCGMKYPGGLLLLPIALVLLRRAASLRDRLAALGGVAGVFVVTFLATTPGAVLEARAFAAGVTKVVGVYAGGWYGYTVDWRHPFKLLEYLATAVFSPRFALACAVFALALFGAFHLLRAARRLALVAFALPVAYMAYFSLQNVMVVRNYQLLVPFFAVTAALGAGELRRRLRSRAVRSLFVLAVAALLGYNAFWLIRANRGILQRGDQEDLLRQLADYVDERPGTLFFLSAGAAEELAAFDGAARANVVEDSMSGASAVICQLRELPYDFPANRPRLFTTWIGPREVNLGYYPTWEGMDRPVVLPMARAADLTLPLPQLIRRSISFPVAPGPGRQVLVMAGDGAAGDLLYVEATAAGGVRFGLERRGAERQPAAPAEADDVRLEPGRPHLLEIEWGALRSRLRVALDRRQVFAFYGRLHASRLGDLRIGPDAGLMPRGTAAFSGTLAPLSATPRPWLPLTLPHPRPPAGGEGSRLEIAPDPARAELPPELWSAAAGNLAPGPGPVRGTTPPGRRAAAHYAPLAAPLDGEYLFVLRYRAAPPGDLTLGALVDDRWVGLAARDGRRLERAPSLTLRVFLRAGQVVWPAILNNHRTDSVPTSFELVGLRVFLRPPPPPGIS